MFVCRRNIADSQTPTRPCDGLVRAWARAHDVSVVFYEGPCCSDWHQGVRAGYGRQKEGSCSGVHVAKGELSRILERALVNPSASLHFVVLVFHLQYFFR